MYAVSLPLKYDSEVIIIVEIQGAQSTLDILNKNNKYTALKLLLPYVHSTYLEAVEVPMSSFLMQYHY